MDKHGILLVLIGWLALFVTGLADAEDDLTILFKAFGAHILDEPVAFPSGNAFFTLDGKNVSLEDRKGQVVLLTFWASWCGVCRQELPQLDRLNKQGTAGRFTILTISNDSDEAALRSFIDENRITLPVLLDRGSTLWNMFNVVSIPRSLIIDPSGFIRAVVVGSANYSGKTFFEIVDRLNNEPTEKKTPPDFVSVAINVAKHEGEVSTGSSFILPLEVTITGDFSRVEAAQPQFQMSENLKLKNREEIDYVFKRDGKEAKKIIHHLLIETEKEGEGVVSSISIDYIDRKIGPDPLRIRHQDVRIRVVNSRTWSYIVAIFVLLTIGATVFLFRRRHKRNEAAIVLPVQIVDPLELLRGRFERLKNDTSSYEDAIFMGKLKAIVGDSLRQRYKLPFRPEALADLPDKLDDVSIDRQGLELIEKFFERADNVQFAKEKLSENERQQWLERLDGLI